MDLTALNIPKNKIELFKKANLHSVESLLYTEPKSYYYFEKNYALIYTDELRNKIEEKTPVAILGICQSVNKTFKNGRSLIKIKVEEENTGKYLHINIIGDYQKYPLYESMQGKRVLVGGKLQYSEEYRSFSMLNPLVFTTDLAKYNRIVPVYSKIKGVSNEYYEEVLENAIIEKGDLDYLPFSLLNQYKLLSFKETLLAIHHPQRAEDILAARKRKVFDDMIYFTCKLEEQAKCNQQSPFILKNTAATQAVLNTLPFQLTKGQESAIQGMLAAAKNQQRISALVQGDVGTGKTIVALAMMIAFAENGYQSVLMAPTAVLAKQHYKELLELTKGTGHTAVFLSTELKTRERKEVLKQIKSGSCSFIVGTHSCISKTVEYKNLALMITDEEHKFGVLQRQALVERSKNGLHNIIMSATPIPRTLANTLYGNETMVFSLDLPANRKPIQTAICSSYKPVLEFMEKEIQKGRQGYVVCPLIDKAEENTKMEGVASLEEVVRIYQSYFTPKNIEIGVITGKTPKQEQEVIFSRFLQNDIKIILATTVIEVGINNPNATVIAITGAERFGLATLHQLRGRVGRGAHQSYCILQKSNAQIEGSNLEILCRETDGLEIAKEDLKNRGTGNLFGKEQSGQNKYIDLLLTYPNMFEKVKGIAKQLCQNHTGKDIIEIYENFFLPQN